MNNFDLNTLDVRAQSMQATDGGDAQWTPAATVVIGTYSVVTGTSKRCV
ncbi:hypothetical protein GCM10017783_26270 [Deinococcus piscis]|uniref:Uncharacterized protein n=1 Tax=Deinococcus piscis TaxID=394230 RepID=A0ABQ3KJ14_9DEIO|nr:hypothetical protein [Deinococcus piscis]GHG13332.1 hypothetical protein GCM10017783_26230 [Deinococcus piscis]GHG13433.1 hypothetical protein GCM10017783_26270 [Deinococcus piscis]